jgi:redox-sensitive bicupin YhaK (pirin superfamily)
MKTIIHRSEDRGAADHGWLQAKHSFSFANYYDPSRLQFGVLRVLNDDIVAPSMGFGKHPHDNMEIITIPLEGSLEHKDSMGNSSIIKAGEIQVMSAGTGIMHSEQNPSHDQPINLLQIWLFPNKRGVTPRYDQQELNTVDMKNNWSQILSPSAEDQGVWIHQNAWFHRGDFDTDMRSTYTLKDATNGVYLFVIEGTIEVAGETLHKRDAIGLTELQSIEINTTNNSKLLLMEVPMN